MSLALCVRQIITLGEVKSQAQAALVLSQMIFHEVGVLGQVDDLHRQSALSLPSVGIGLRFRSYPSRTGFGLFIYFFFVRKGISRVVSYMARTPRSMDPILTLKAEDE